MNLVIEVQNWPDSVLLVDVDPPQRLVDIVNHLADLYGRETLEPVGVEQSPEGYFLRTSLATLEVLSKKKENVSQVTITGEEEELYFLADVHSKT